MNNFLAYLCLGVSVSAFVAGSCLFFYRVGYKYGKSDAFQSGYDSGRIDAERWWERAELEVQREREKIWMEGE